MVRTKEARQGGRKKKEKTEGELTCCTAAGWGGSVRSGGKRKETHTGEICSHLHIYIKSSCFLFPLTFIVSGFIVFTKVSLKSVLIMSSQYIPDNSADKDCDIFVWVAFTCYPMLTAMSLTRVVGPWVLHLRLHTVCSTSLANSCVRNHSLITIYCTNIYCPPFYLCEYTECVNLLVIC